MCHRGALIVDANILRLLEAADPLVGFGVAGLHEESFVGRPGDAHCSGREKSVIYLFHLSFFCVVNGSKVKKKMQHAAPIERIQYINSLGLMGVLIGASV